MSHCCWFYLLTWLFKPCNISHIYVVVDMKEKLWRCICCDSIFALSLNLIFYGCWVGNPGARGQFVNWPYWFFVLISKKKFRERFSLNLFDCSYSSLANQGTFCSSFRKGISWSSRLILNMWLEKLIRCRLFILTTKRTVTFLRSFMILNTEWFAQTSRRGKIVNIWSS